MALNKTNVLKVADVIEGKKRRPKGFHFNMLHWMQQASDLQPHKGWNGKLREHTCGTVGCIGGLTNTLFGGSIMDDAQAARHLGLDYSDSRELFMPYSLGEHDWEKITPRQAARVLRHLAKTGKVDWSIIKTKRAAS